MYASENAKECMNPILIMHQTVGFPMVPDDIDPRHPLFDSFDMVFNGHIHQYSKVNARFINVGTPIHRDAGDIGQEKGYLIYDIETGKYERVITEGYPVFRKVEEGGDPIPEEWKDDYIMWVPKAIEVTPEGKEIQENFNHNKVPRTTLLNNYLDMKVTEESELNKGDVFNYGNKLMEYADKV